MPSTRAPPSRPGHLLNVLPPKTISLRVRISTQEFRGTHSFSNTLCGDSTLEANRSVLSPSLTPAVVKSSQRCSKQVWLSWEERSRTVCGATKKGPPPKAPGTLGRNIKGARRVNTLLPLSDFPSGFPIGRTQWEAEAEEPGGGVRLVWGGV